MFRWKVSRADVEVIPLRPLFEAVTQPCQLYGLLLAVIDTKISRFENMLRDRCLYLPYTSGI